MKRTGQEQWLFWTDRLCLISRSGICSSDCHGAGSTQPFRQSRRLRDLYFGPVFISGTVLRSANNCRKFTSEKRLSWSSHNSTFVTSWNQSFYFVLLDKTALRPSKNRKQNHDKWPFTEHQGSKIYFLPSPFIVESEVAWTTRVLNMWTSVVCLVKLV